MRKLGRNGKRQQGFILQAITGALPPGMRVLLVEDEPLILMHGESLLHSLGVAEVICARSLAEGFDALSAGTFDVAIIDLQLGTETSLPLAQKLIELDIPFAILTGYQGAGIPRELQGRPVIPKPFVEAHLLQALSELVQPR